MICLMAVKNAINNGMTRKVNADRNKFLIELFPGKNYIAFEPKNFIEYNYVKCHHKTFQKLCESDNTFCSIQEKQYCEKCRFEISENRSYFLIDTTKVNISEF